MRVRIRGKQQSMAEGSKIPGSFKQWCLKELSKILHSSVEDDLLEYLLSIEGEKDLREYLQDLLGDDTKQAQVFIQEFLRHWKPASQTLSHSSNPIASVQNVMRPNTDQMGPESGDKEV